VLIVTVAIAGCSDGGSKTSSTTGSPSGSTTGPAAGITISGFAFQVPASVKAGEVITITNDDGVAHTFSDTGGAFDVKISGGSSEQLTVTAPGTYSVVCHIHSSMKTTLTVT
jgi:plastocyanin